MPGNEFNMKAKSVCEKSAICEQNFKKAKSYTYAVLALIPSIIAKLVRH